MVYNLKKYSLLENFQKAIFTFISNNYYPFKASAPPTISKISLVIAA